MTLAVGVVKEVKTGERRVALTPPGVHVLTDIHIPVYVEESAGVQSGFTNEAYLKAGAILVSDNSEVWSKADLIKKVKEPVASEFRFIQARHIIFTYLHLASPSERPLVDALVGARATAIGYETIEKENDTPLLRPMSEIAGVLTAYFAGVFQNHIAFEEGTISGMDEARRLMEKLASQYPSVPEHLPLGSVVVLGGGHVGLQSSLMAAKMGGKVSLAEISEVRRQKLREEFRSNRLTIQVFDPQEATMFSTLLESCDVLIAAVHIAGERAPLIVDSKLLSKISNKKKKIIFDIAIDQGGNVAESYPRDYNDPLYLDSFGNLRFSVTNIPSLCGRGASVALEEVTLDYTIALAGGLKAAIRQYPELETGINVLDGKVVNHAVWKAHHP